MAQARDRGCDMTSYVPGHPLAGREKARPRGGPRRPVPRPDLGAVPGSRDIRAGHRGGHGPGPGVRRGTDPDRRGRPRPLGRARIPRPAPGGRGHGGPAGAAPPEALDLAGQGLRDVTRIAAGDTGLWTQILAANAEPVAEVLAAVAADLAEAARMLTDGDPKSVATLLDHGRRGVARIPGKHGGRAPRVHRRPGRHPATSPASWPGCSTRPARPGSTSRTSGSSTRPACRSAWRNSPSAPPRPGPCWTRWRPAGGRSAVSVPAAPVIYPERSRCLPRPPLRARAGADPTGRTAPISAGRLPPRRPGRPGRGLI